MKDILKEITERRTRDMETKGKDYGFRIPEKRLRPVHPFIETKGSILEVKRASPSKGDIAPDLDSFETAYQYAMAGARAISCLTEVNYFKGTLEDLMKVCQAVDKFEKDTGKNGPAVLRKDFLLDPEEVEIAYRAGADAVLLIARILDSDTMLAMAQKAEELGISVLIEMRKDEDLEKLERVMSIVDHSKILCGVNSRDLKDFTIDMLIPASMYRKIKSIAPDARVTFESGILSPLSAAFAGSMGFDAILLGEAAARNPKLAQHYTRSFQDTEENQNGRRWLDYASRVSQAKRPLVKICGITNTDDCIMAAEFGADYLGFILWAYSKRNTDERTIRECHSALKEKLGDRMPKLVGVVVDFGCEEFETAKRLVEEGILDSIQLHGIDASRKFVTDKKLKNLPHYCAVNIGFEGDTEKLDLLNSFGEPRILVDAKSKDKAGGTGKRIDTEILKKIGAKYRLCIAGGIGPDNVAQVIEDFHPEFIDLSSSLETAPGKKDPEKLKKFFGELDRIS